mgnify:CR=1 FL=1
MFTVAKNGIDALLAIKSKLLFVLKNAFLDELGKPYYITAKAKGLSEKRILYGHIFQNAMLIVIAGFPSLLISMLFTGSVKELTGKK